MIARVATLLVGAAVALLAQASTVRLQPAAGSVLEVQGSEEQALLRFNLAGVPADSNIVSARLTLRLAEVGAHLPIPLKRFSFAAGGTQGAVLAVTKPGDYAVDLTRLVRKKGPLSISVTGMEGNPSATIASPVLEVRWSRTAPRANAGGDVFLPVGRQGPVRLDGSQSGSGLKYEWSVGGRKIGDTAVVSFSPKAPGYYVVKLRVTNRATGEHDEDTAAVMTGLRPHPRLQVDDSVLGQIRKLRDANDPLWTRFDRSLQSRPKGGGTGAQGTFLTANLLASLVTGEKQYFDAAWSIAKARLYKDGKNRSSGVVRLIDIYKDDRHKAAFQGGQFIGQMSLVYDWGYQHLTPEERQDIIGWLNEAVEFNYLNNKAAHSMMRNDGASFTYGLAAAVYATLDENPEGHKVFGWFRHNWDELLKSLDIIGKGGASGEGNAYGAAPTASSIIRTANLVYYASGEDLFLSHPFFKQKLLFDAFGAYPGSIGGKGSAARYPDSPMMEEASIGGDGRRGASWHSGALRPNGLILSRRFKDTPEADIWNWVYRQPEVDHPQSGGDAVADLLYYTPRPHLVKPARLSFFDPSMGYVYIRSDWDSPDATWIAFWAGPHIDTHEHLDQGAFTIFKRRDLAPKTGHYDTEIRAPHDLSWYIRTISSNGLLIGDPSESFRGFNQGIGCDGKGNGQKITAPWSKEQLCPPNDGGQRTMMPHSLAVANADMFNAYRDAFDIARVVSFKDDGHAVSVVADLTNAYNNPRYSSQGNSPKVTKVYRRLVYLRGADVLLVGDTVESVNPKFEKKWLIHALDRIEVAGDVRKIDAGESVHTNVDHARIIVDDSDPSDQNQTTFDLRKGYAALLMKTVFPIRFRYREIGGREPAATPHPDAYLPDKNAEHFHRHIKDFWVKDFSEGVIPNHKSANWVPETPLEVAAKEYIPVYGPGYGRWRLEVEPAAPAKTDYFLNVLKPTLDPNEKLPEIQRVETADQFGAEIRAGGKTFVVTFSKGTLAAPRVSEK